MSSNPNWLGRAVLRLCAPKSDRETILGDLVEEFHELEMQGQPLVTRQIWFLRQAITSAGSLLVMKWRREKMWRSILAVGAGYFTLAVLIMAVDISFYVLAGKPANGPSARYMTFSLISGFFFVMLGGYVTARIARGRERRITYQFAAFCFLMSIMSAASSFGQEPLWYQIALAVTGPSGAAIGGLLRARQISRIHAKEA